jgi:ATP-dependent RNA helicase DDX55/SPB4
VKACTGSGKTLSFAIPLVQKILGMQKQNEIDEL